MAFLKKPLKWTALGQEPSELKKSEGFKMDESPAPGHFDFMFRSTYEAIEELQQKAGEVKTVNNVQPDGNGNVLIPLPDVSKFYQKPPTGIPKTDLSTDVQTSLTKAESALQSVPLATAALDGLMAKGDKASLDNVMSVFANLQKMKITNDDGSAVYTIGATLPTVKKGIFHATASTGTYAPPSSSVEGIIIAESASYWNFIGASDNGTWCVGAYQGSWKGWTTLATAKDVSNLSTRITALETSDTTHKADLASQASGKGASLVGIEDSSGKFTATNVEAALLELFTFANDGKTNIANVIGSPATTSDTFAQLVSRITTNKSNLATNLTNKGQSASASETLAALIAKVANINTGKKWATGTLTSGSQLLPFTLASNLTVANLVPIECQGLAFRPSVVIAWYLGRIYLLLPEEIEAGSVGSTGRVVVSTLNNSYSPFSTQSALFKLDGTSAYVSGNGFRIPTSITNTAGFAIKYYAFE